MQTSPYSLGNLYKRALVNRVDWWFAYNYSVADFLKEKGFSLDHITVVQNAIDTKNLIAAADDVSQEELQSLRQKLEIDENDAVGLFCGGMYAEKRLDFLIEACCQIKKSLPNFKMIFIGGGYDEDKVKAACVQNSWMKYLGPNYDIEKIKCFMLSDAVLMPGLVGLAILDCFAFQKPIITTDYAFHSPEIDYLKHDYNGFITHNSVEDYCSGVVRLLTKKEDMSKLKSGCQESVKQYSIERMVDNFADGVLACLDVKTSVPPEKEKVHSV